MLSIMKTLQLSSMVIKYPCSTQGHVTLQKQAKHRNIPRTSALDEDPYTQSFRVILQKTVAEVCSTNFSKQNKWSTNEPTVWWLLYICIPPSTFIYRGDKCWKLYQLESYCKTKLILKHEVALCKLVFIKFSHFSANLCRTESCP